MRIIIDKTPYFNSNKIDLCILFFGKNINGYGKLMFKIKLLTYKK